MDSEGGYPSFAAEFFECEHELAAPTTAATTAAQPAIAKAELRGDAEAPREEW